MEYKILLVDDEAANLRLLERLFRRQHQIISATSGAEGLEMLKRHDIALIISDQRMPSMTGIEFLRRAAEMRQHTVRIILTGYTDVNALVEAINSGIVYKYVTKPWINEDLQQTVDRALQHYETIKSQHELTLLNNRLSEQIESTRNGFFRSIGDTLDLKDPFLHAHMRRTSNYAIAIGYRLGLQSAELKQLSRAGFLHEIGKIGIPDNILSKETAALTEEERKIVKGNFERGVRILESFPDMQNIASAVRHYNKRFDGSGSSPESLAAERIPLYARIIAVAHAYDEMTGGLASNGNNEALTHEEALEKLQDAAGNQFDPKIVAVFGKLKPIGQIRQVINNGVSGMELLPTYISSDINNLSTVDLLHKFKTEPMLALDVLRLANTEDNNETAAQLLPAMTRIGEEKLRQRVRQYGLPVLDEKTQVSITRALRRANAAQLLAAHSGIIHPDDAYSLGLLHDIGEILLLNLFPGEMLGLEEFEEEVRRMRQIELFGIDYAQISQWMLEACGVPHALTTAISTHQEEMRVNTPISMLMYLADKIAKASESDKFAAVEAAGTEVLTALHLNRANLRAIYERAISITEEQMNTRQEDYVLA